MEIAVTNLNQFSKIIVLIDAENAQAGKTDQILKDISTYGRIVTKRAYANWAKSSVKPWEEIVKKYAIRTIQQFDFASGKNASDMAMTIDAMEQLYIGNYDCFVIVSSDSDFTPLAMKLHESGVIVIGYGKRNSTESFRNACDEFKYVEDIPAESEIRFTEDTTSSAEPADNSTEKAITKAELNSLLFTAAENFCEDDGFAPLGAAGKYIKRVHPDFTIKAFGYKKLSEYLEARKNIYEVEKRTGKGGMTNIVYRVR